MLERQAGGRAGDARGKVPGDARGAEEVRAGERDGLVRRTLVAAKRAAGTYDRGGRRHRLAERGGSRRRVVRLFVVARRAARSGDGGGCRHRRAATTDADAAAAAAPSGTPPTAWTTAAPAASTSGGRDHSSRRDTGGSLGLAHRGYCTLYLYPVYVALQATKANLAKGGGPTLSYEPADPT